MRVYFQSTGPGALLFWCCRGGCFLFGFVIDRMGLTSRRISIQWRCERQRVLLASENVLGLRKIER